MSFIGSIRPTHNFTRQQGFTLIEMMVVVAILAILAAIAVPSYRNFVQRSDIEKVKSIMMMQANELNKWRARQLNYARFEPQSQTFDSDNKTFHYPASGTSKYNIAMVTITGSGTTLAASTFADAHIANNYVILATPVQLGMPYIALTSQGMQCQSLDSTITAVKVFTDNNCGTGSKSW